MATALDPKLEPSHGDNASALAKNVNSIVYQQTSAPDPGLAPSHGDNLTRSLRKTNQLLYSNPPGGGGAGIPEAPTDGQLYGRKSAAWSVVPSGGAGGAATATRNFLLNGNFELVPFHWYGSFSRNSWFADMWYYGGTSDTTGTFQAAQYGPALGTNAQSSTTMRITPQTTQASFAASSQASLFTWIEGKTYNVFAGAPFTVAGNINPAAAGVHSISVRNGAGTQSFIHAVTVSAGQVGTWVPFSFTVPVPASLSGFSFGSGTVGLKIGFSVGAGSSVQTSTLDVWQSGNFYAANGQVNLLNTGQYCLAEFGVYASASAPPAYLYSEPDAVAHVCQRYFGYNAQKGFNILGTAGDISGAAGMTGNQLGGLLAFPHAAANTYALVTSRFEVDLMQVPAVTIYNNQGSGVAQDTNESSPSVTGITAEATSLSAAQIGRITSSGGSTFTAGHIYVFYYFADARPALT